MLCIQSSSSIKSKGITVCVWCYLPGVAVVQASSVSCSLLWRDCHRHHYPILSHGGVFPSNNNTASPLYCTRTIVPRINAQGSVLLTPLQCHLCCIYLASLCNIHEQADDVSMADGARCTTQPHSTATQHNLPLRW